MTTDGFTDAARAYAEQACYQDENIPIAEAGFRAGWKAARAYLTAQEPNDAGPHELDNDAPVLNLGYYRSSARCKCGYEVIWGEHDGDAGLGEAWRVHLMRSAVHAFRAARRDKEK